MNISMSYGLDIAQHSIYSYFEVQTRFGMRNFYHYGMYYTCLNIVAFFFLKFLILHHVQSSY
jgi:hypothetical protein